MSPAFGPPGAVAKPKVVFEFANPKHWAIVLSSPVWATLFSVGWVIGWSVALVVTGYRVGRKS